MKFLVAIGLVLCGSLEAASQTLVLKAGSTLPVSVTVDERIHSGPLHSIQYMGGLVSCEMPPPGTDKDLACPTFGVAFTIKKRLETSAELRTLLQGKPAARVSESADEFRLQDDRKLSYRKGELEFQLDISSYFLPGTGIRHQWSGETATSDVLFVISETCDDLQDCRSGLWFFSVLKDPSAKGKYAAFRSSLVPLLGKVDWPKLEAAGYGLQVVEASLAIVLPFEGTGVPVVAWVATFVENAQTGITELRFDVHPAEWSDLKKE